MIPFQRHLKNKMGYFPNIDKVLIYDIECWSSADITQYFEGYKRTAIVRCVGFYSYKTCKYYNIPYTRPELIQKLLDEHEILVGFNNVAFDNPILTNNKNNFTLNNKKFMDLKILFRKKAMDTIKPYPYTNSIKEILSGRRYSLKNIAKALNFDAQKGDIDYMIFKKEEYTELEWKEINMYTYNDIMMTKELFEFMMLESTKLEFYCESEKNGI